MERQICEKGVILPERFRLTPEEAALAAKAVGDYAISVLRVLEINWPLESLHAVTDLSGQDTLDRIEYTARHLNRGSQLIRKLTSMEDAPNGFEFSREELVMLGDALFNFGLLTTREAMIAIDMAETGVYVRFGDPERKQNTIRLIEETTPSTKALFDKINPVLIAYGLPRMLWRSDLI